MSTATMTKETLDRSQQRNLFLLATCQAFGQAGNTMMFVATALSVVTFYEHRELATLPMTLQHLGVMAWVFPASMIMQRFGRLFGFRIGSVMGMTGAILAGTGLYTRNFPLMCFAGFILGYAVASLQMYRFAAVELVPGSYRARAISWVTAGGVVAGIIGPSLARWTHDKWTPLYLATYAGMFGLHVIVFTVMSFIKFPSMRDLPPGHAPAAGPAAPPRSLWVIATQPRFMAAVIAGMVSYGTMSFLMSASPLAIVGCGLPHTEAHWVIFMHVMGMFIPSFFTGNLITRFGVLPVMMAGALTLGAGVLTSLAGMTEWHFRIALSLNGVGWNFLFVGATTLVTTCYRPNERGKTQALNDFLVFGTTATSSFFAGFLQERLGWVPLNEWSIILIAMAVFAVIWLKFQRQPVAA